MKVVVVVLVQGGTDVELAARDVAGRPLIGRLVERMHRARCVERVVVMCREGRDRIAALLGETAQVVETSDPILAATRLRGAHEGMAFCPVGQLFADPARLDALAARPLEPGSQRVHAVLSGDETIALVGGAFLDVVTRDGLDAVARGRALSDLPATTWTTLPEAPEMRIEDPGDEAWAVALWEALLTHDPSGGLDRFEETLGRSGLTRFSFWDHVGNPPGSILTVRCFRQPLFERFVAHLMRVPGATVDVLCSRALVDETASVPGIGRVLSFEQPTLRIEALDNETLAEIRATRYDLCVIPRREPTGRGFDNLVPLARVAGAHCAVWLDVFGRSGLLVGEPHGWEAGGDADCPADLAPCRQPWVYERRAARALDRFTAPIGLPADLLAQLHENLTCRPLVDNPGLGIDLSSVLIAQLPPSADIGRRLAQLESMPLPWVPPLAAAVDALFRHLVHAEAGQPSAAGPPGAALSPGASSSMAIPAPTASGTDAVNMATEVLAPVARALAALVEHAQGRVAMGGS